MTSPRVVVCGRAVDLLVEPESVSSVEICGFLDLVLSAGVDVCVAEAVS